MKVQVVSIAIGNLGKAKVIAGFPFRAEAFVFCKNTGNRRYRLLFSTVR